MSAWKKAGGSGKYLRFEAGTAWEGVFKGFEVKPNKFYDPKKENSHEMSADYLLEIGGEEKILSSPALTLKDQLQSLETPCNIKIECTQNGIKKLYVVWIEDTGETSADDISFGENNA